MPLTPSRSRHLATLLILCVALGLYFSADIIGQLARFSGWILGGVVWAFVLGFGLAWLMERLAGMDRPSVASTV